jgi:arabinofuranan 3-O-arabinosyltransferase
MNFLLRPRVRWGICWFIFLGSAGFMGVQAWTAFNEPTDKAQTAFNQADCSDGNRGHATIDFGGQWLMGRMIVEGQGRHLYLRNYLRPVAQQAFPTRRCSTHKSDAEALMEWLAGTDDPEAARVIASLLPPLTATNPVEEAAALMSAQMTWTEEQLEHVTAPRVGGGLYPPIHSLYYAPLALLPPQIAYRVMQVLILILACVAGWLAQRMTEGRVWWPAASLFVLMFPGFAGCVTLGQNGMFLLILALLGWQQLMRGREVLAGLCWGLLAFKPVWAAVFFLVPLVTTRWRMAASMAAAGIVQIVVTLPIVGWESWQHWLQVGQDAAQEYKRQENWIVLSRDLLGIPRRWLLTFENGLAKDIDEATASGQRFLANPNVLGWGLWATILTATLFVVWRCQQRRKEQTGLFPAFVLSAAVLTCYHFMYYDFVVAGLPVLLLFTQPRQYLQWQFHTLVPPLLLILMLAMPALGCLYDPSYHFPPWETFILIALWAWCGYCLWKEVSFGKKLVFFFAAQLAELGADVGGAHERLAD